MYLFFSRQKRHVANYARFLTSSLNHSHNFVSLFILICMSLNGARKPDLPKETHADKREHAYSTQKEPRLCYWLFQSPKIYGDRSKQSLCEQTLECAVMWFVTLRLSISDYDWQAGDLSLTERNQSHLGRNEGVHVVNRDPRANTNEIRIDTAR